jgi:hypothetical protein
MKLPLVSKNVVAGMFGAVLLAAASSAVTARALQPVESPAKEVRERLQSLVAIEDDDEFLAACLKLLEEHGLTIALNFGGLHPLGGGFDFMVSESKEGDWVLRASDEREVRLPKRRFVKFLSEGQVLDQAPADAEKLAKTILFIGGTEIATFFDLRTGLMKRFQPEG